MCTRPSSRATALLPTALLPTPRPYSLPTALLPTALLLYLPTALLPTRGAPPRRCCSTRWASTHALTYLPTYLLQVLQYEVGQYYGGHHDFIPAHSRLPCGPRVYTLFMYLSEVSK